MQPLSAPGAPAAPAAPTVTPLPPLSATEARVLGVLVEKQRTVPDSYPLSLNALVTGCNQKTSRMPVMELAEAEILAAIDSLQRLTLVSQISGGRVARFEHNFERRLRIPSQSSILLTALMLRGPQTPGELRIACERMHAFADISSVEAFLDELAERPAGALVVKLQRQAGSREARWAHLLSGPVNEAAAAGNAAEAATQPASFGELDALRAQVQRLEAEVASLRGLCRRLCAELGIETEGSDPAPAAGPGAD